jgi:hypothetical protein
MEYAGSQFSEQAQNRPEHLVHPMLRSLYSYWLARCGSAAWPLRSTIDPLDLKPLLGHIALLEAEYGADSVVPLRFRYRLFGTHFVEWFGFDMTGRLIDDWPAPEYRVLMNASYREVTVAGRPFRRLRSFVKDNRVLRYEALMLPLGAPARVEQIMVAQVFTE